MELQSKIGAVTLPDPALRQCAEFGNPFPLAISGRCLYLSTTTDDELNSGLRTAVEFMQI